MHHHIYILHKELTVEFDYKITAPGAPESGPSYYSGGEPAEPMEYEAFNIELFDNNTKLEMPKWLEEIIEEELSNSESVYQNIDEDREQDYEF